MNIEKIRKAYEENFKKFNTDNALNEYAPHLHKMLVKEKNFEKVYNSSKYKQESASIECDFEKISLSELISYERILEGSDTKF